VAFLSLAQPAIVGNLATRQDWTARVVKDAWYEAPSGKRIGFDFVSVSREIELRRVAFEFPQINDAYVQDNGYGARKYPLLCIFTGAQHDLLATAFEAALIERGRGTLRHPFYGTFKAIAYGTIVRRNDLVNEANQSIVEVTFWTSTGEVYPTTSKSARNEILAAIALFNASAASSFANRTQLASTVAKVNTTARIRKWLRDVQASIGKVAGAVSTVNRKFRDAQKTINYGLDTLIGTPLILAQQISNLISAPARANVGIQSRLDSYNALAQSIMTSTVVSTANLISGLTLASERLKRSNDFHTADLFVTSSVIGSLLSSLENTYTTRAEALDTAAQVLARLADVIVWREDRFESLDQIDTGETYQALQQAAGLVAGYLIESAASLSGGASQAISDGPDATGVLLQSGTLNGVPAAILASGKALIERVIVVDRPRTILDLCAELYGNPDADGILDFFINTNAFTGQEIIELQKGREVRFYK
jgi:prophage DNA circulation protein